ncbi:cupin domain-containing protein [Sporolactobacillus vineae]|uniref:cupin domain-containing protein n=1 Tax=Sporolactobacillus vineae TaxID=444463 RepID=UPI000289BAE4|nr:cupin domain-containing protein [Sporolactobacillus vineae]
MTENVTEKIELKDYGSDPFAVHLADAAKQNTRYRTTLWTGDHFQVTLMSIPAGGGDIGMEIHHGNDQFLYLVDGKGKVEMGKDKNKITVSREVTGGDAVIVPDETWHNVTNIGDKPMKVYSIYSPVKHAKNTDEETKADAIKQEGPLEGTNE